MASTSGSLTAWSMNASTLLANDSYGWCTSTSSESMTRKMSTPPSSLGGLWHARCGESLLEVGSIDFVETPEAAEVERPCNGVDVLGGKLELAHQQPLDLLRHGVVDLEPDDLW